jgi:hypothetical protein
MLENPLSATVYIWEKGQPFNIDELLLVLGGRVAPSEREMLLHRMGNPMYCTPDYRIYPVTKEQDRLAPEVYSPQTNASRQLPHFRTYNLEKRLSEYGLELPDHELCFIPREDQYHINPNKVRGAAAYLILYSNLDLLCVPGTSIEENQYLASESITKRLGMVPK